MLRFLRSVSHHSLALEQRLVEFQSNFTFRVSLVQFLNFPNGKLNPDPNHTLTLMVKKKELLRFFVCCCFGGGLGREVLGLTLFCPILKVYPSFILFPSFALFMFDECCVFLERFGDLSPPFLPYCLRAQPSNCLLKGFFIRLLLGRPL